MQGTTFQKLLVVVVVVVVVVTWEGIHVSALRSQMMSNDFCVS